MQLVKVRNSTLVTHLLAAQLRDALDAHKTVVWLISGGSNLQVEVDMMNTIPDALTARLYVFLIDERFGAVGHKDSNYYQLQSLKFPEKTAHMYPVLLPKLDLKETVASYDHSLHDVLDRSDYAIAQLGMGTDGHIAGMLPHSPAIEETSNYVTSYQGPDFMRITTTPSLLHRMQRVNVLSFGESKHHALTNLVGTQLSVTEQPAQLLKTLSNVVVYNDYMGDDV